MDQDSGAEWSEETSAALGGCWADWATWFLQEFMQRHGRLSSLTASSTKCYLTSPFTRGASRTSRDAGPPPQWIYNSHVCLVADLLGVHAWRLLHRTQHKSTLNFPHPYSLVHIYIRSDLHDPLLWYPPLLPQKIVLDINAQTCVYTCLEITVFVRIKTVEHAFCTGCAVRALLSERFSGVVSR